MSTDLCMNRAHVREDMLWLTAHAFDAVHTACHEEHYRQPRGLHMIIEEAHRVGLSVQAIPSRWCGLVAGWPVLAGHFAATRPDTWMRDASGNPVIKGFCGPVCSVHHPDVRNHMIESTTRMLETFEFDGITWDELKTLHETDHHPLAVQTHGAPVSGAPQIKANLDLFAACNMAARAVRSDLRIVSFVYADLADDIVREWARTDGFDEIGPDGRCAWKGDPGVPHTKTLLDNVPRFVDAARAANRGTFALVETQQGSWNPEPGEGIAQAETTIRRLPELLELEIDHVATYFRPLVDAPEAEITDTIGPILKDWRTAG
jgi:1,4-alpha-glucan branching enzyme